MNIVTDFIRRLLYVGEMDIVFELGIRFIISDVNNVNGFDIYNIDIIIMGKSKRGRREFILLNIVIFA